MHRPFNHMAFLHPVTNFLEQSDTEPRLLMTVRAKRSGDIYD